MTDKIPHKFEKVIERQYVSAKSNLANSLLSHSAVL